MFIVCAIGFTLCGLFVVAVLVTLLACGNGLAAERGLIMISFLFGLNLNSTCSADARFAYFPSELVLMLTSSLHFEWVLQASLV